MCACVVLPVTTRPLEVKAMVGVCGVAGLEAAGGDGIPNANDAKGCEDADCTTRPAPLACCIAASTPPCVPPTPTDTGGAAPIVAWSG